MRGIAGALAVILVVAACGVQDDSAPRALREDVPFDLLAPATSVAPAESGEGAAGIVWLVDNDGRLARGGRRQVTRPVTPRSILEALLDGVTDVEADAGLRSNIVSGTRLLGVKGPDNGLVTVDFSGAFLTVSRELQRLALAQVVFTVTGLANVDHVLFEFDGKPAEVPGRGDELTGEPLARADFAQFDPTVTTP